MKATRRLRHRRPLCLSDGTPIARDRVIKAIQARSASRIWLTVTEGAEYAGVSRD